MAYRELAQMLQTLPAMLRVWKALSTGSSAISRCIQTIAKLDGLEKTDLVKQAIVSEWATALPVILQLSEKLPARTDMICHYIKALPVLMQISRNLPERDSIFVQQFPELAGLPVIREEYLVDMSKGKRVLHFGFLDAPFSEDRVRSGDLLHLKLKQVASHLYGIDSNGPALDRYRQLTGDSNNDVEDIQQMGQPSIHSRSYDLILFPEILEHLGNPGKALENLKQVCLKSAGAKLCVTVPNAYYAGSFLRALDGDEIVHPEHYYYFSPATLRKLLSDAGFAVLEMALYGSRDSAALPGITKNGVIAVCQLA